MLDTGTISPPGAATARFLPPTPVNDAERHRRRFLRLVAQFERNEIEAAVDGLIAILDARDGDADLEPDGDDLGDIAVDSFLPRHPAYRHAEYRDADAAMMTEDDEADGDELDGNGAEDDFMRHPADGPGCPIADPDCCVEAGSNLTGAGDATFAEWHTLPAAARRAGRIEGRPISEWRGALHEDEEDDDRDAGVEDGQFDPEEDCCMAGDDRIIGGPGVGYTTLGFYDGRDDEDCEREQLPHDVPMLPVIALQDRRYLGRSNLMTSFRSNGGWERSADSGRRHRSTGWANRPGTPV